MPGADAARPARRVTDRPERRRVEHGVRNLRLPSPVRVLCGLAFGAALGPSVQLPGNWIVLFR
jgi:hypothetical protein